MFIVQSGQPFGFNYTTYDQNASLFVAFNVYDVTSGTAVFLSQVTGVYANFGSYVGSFNAVAGKTYLVIGIVYTDGTYITPDLTRSPTADVFQAFQGTVLNLGFTYASFSQDATLFVKAAVYNTTSGAPILASSVVMAHVAFGVYYGAYAGILFDSFQVVGVVYTDGTYLTPDLNYAPSSDSFECLQAGVGVVGAAYLVSQYGQTVNFGPRVPRNLIPPIFVTQGDVATLNLKAVDVNGMPVDLTGASFTTYINGENGQAVQSFPNSQHVIQPDQVNFRGQFNLSLTSLNTGALGVGEHKEILTAITIGASIIYFRGFNLLGVLPPVPLE